MKRPGETHRTQDRPAPRVLSDLVPCEGVNTVAASGSAYTIPEVTQYTMSNITVTANCAFTFPTAIAGTSFTMRLKQDGTGSRVPTWPAAAKWPGGTAPTLSTGANKVDLLSWGCFDGSTWDSLGYSLDSR